jgi:hypothetical protein
MNKTDMFIVVIAVLAVVAAVTWFERRDQPPEVLDLPPETDVKTVTVEPEEAEIRYPVPDPPAPIEPSVTGSETTELPPQPEEATEEVAQPPPPQVNPLPTLEQSDDALRQDLYILAARQALDSLFNMNSIIRRFVVTVDNLPRKHLPRSKYRSNQMISGQLMVEKDNYGMYLSEENFARYDAIIDLLESMNTDQLVAFYLYYYPLIQTAYEDLGYPSAYFNDRLIDVIDQLLRTPETSGRIRLVRPRVLYKYNDPNFEALSAGQKVLIRIGPHNASRVKTKLRELRRGLVRE